MQIFYPKISLNIKKYFNFSKIIIECQTIFCFDILASLGTLHSAVCIVLGPFKTQERKIFAYCFMRITIVKRNKQNKLEIFHG